MSIGKEFMRLTTHAAAEPSLQEQGQAQPPLELPFTGERLPLPAPNALSLPQLDLRALLANRRSLRRYSPQPLTQPELAFLLWSTQGVQSVTQRATTLRTVPSAGARHAFETFVLANRVVGLDPGLYRYLALSHELGVVNTSAEIGAEMVAACKFQEKVAVSAITVIWVAIVERMYWRYGERGYRYLHLDAGHACQNMILAGEAIGAGSCAVGAFLDDEINALLGLDGENQFVIYAATLGKRPHATAE